MRRLSTEAASEASARRRWTILQRDSSVQRSVIAVHDGAVPVSPGLIPQRAGSQLASAPHVAFPVKRFVYIIRSSNHPQKRYIGVTSDVAARVSAHNAGQNRSTAPWKPWEVDVTIEFRTERIALRFEKYLKSGAGHAFAASHFVDRP